MDKSLPDGAYLTYPTYEQKSATRLVEIKAGWVHVGKWTFSQSDFSA